MAREEKGLKEKLTQSTPGKAFKEWSKDKAPTLAAALSFYALFSLAPVLVLLLVIAGFFFGQGQAQQNLVQTLQGVLGPQAADAAAGVLTAANQPTTGGIAAILSILVLLFGAAAIFAHLQDSLNAIWDIESKKGGWKDFLKDRLVGALVVIVLGALFVAIVVASAGVNALGTLVTGAVPGGVLLWRIVNILLSLAVVALVFALLFKYLPDARVAWKEVWVGAGVTAVLFVIGKELLGIYLANNSTASVYGAAGSLVLLLFWIYYSSLILFLGAEYTQIYARRHGHPIRPKEGARRAHGGGPAVGGGAS